MGILKTSFIGIKGKKTQTFIIFLIILLILLFEITGLLISSASQVAKEDAYRQIGLRIDISLNYDIQDTSDIGITDEMLCNIMAKEHVAGYDSNLEIGCTPINFKNTKIYTGVNPATQNNQADDISEEIEKEKNQITLIAGLNSQYNEHFYMGQNVLIEGEYPHQNHQGALISEQLAEENNLKIGDILSMVCDETQNSADLEVIGIYQTNLKFEILETNFLGEGVFRVSPYNQVYTDYDVVSLLLNNNCPLSYLTVWIDAPQNIQAVIDEVANDKTWDDFKTYDITGIVYNQDARQLTAMSNMSEYLIVLSLLFGAIILIIAMTFYGNSYMYETGLYTVLGMKKGRVLLIQLLQIFIIVLAALLISLALSPLITAVLNNVIEINYISSISDSTLSSYDMGETNIQQNFHVTITPEVFAGMAAALFIIAAASALIPFLATIRMKPGEILTENKRG